MLEGRLGTVMFGIFAAITLFWILEFVFFRSKIKNSKSRDFSHIASAIVGSIALSVAMFRIDRFQVQHEAWSDAITVVGLVLYFCALLLKYWASISLGEYFTRDIVAFSNQRLISHGPYRKLRHPLYLSLFFLTLSVPIFLSNWLGFVVTLIVMSTLLNRRMALEEQAMETVIGKRYVSWKNRRYRFIPYFY